MIKTLIVILLALPLVSFAPVPTPIYRVRLAAQTSAPPAQACSYETATSRLSQGVSDPIGIPYGFVQAWSCSGDTQAVVAELNARVSDMQAQAAAYRASHPIKGMP